MRRLGLGWILLAVACSDDPAVDDDAELPNGPAPYDHPADYDRRGCRDDAFVDVTPQGIYAFELTWDDGSTGSVSARIDPYAFGHVTGVLGGFDADVAWASNDSRLLFRHVGEPTDRASRSLFLCNRDGDTVLGQYVACNNAGECFIAAAMGTKVEPLDEAPASGLTELGSYTGASWEPGESLNVRVDGDVAYLVRRFTGLHIIDVADPAAPRELATVPTAAPGETPDSGRYVNDVKLVARTDGRRFALLADNRVGITPVDVTDPAAPVRGPSFGRAPLDDNASVHTLFVDGGKAYLGDLNFGLEIWDVADPLAPVYLGNFFPADAPDGSFLHDLYVEGDRAYLNFWRAGMVIADVSNPAAVTEVGRFAGYGDGSSHSSWVTTVGGRRIAAHGDEEYGSHLRLVDVTEGTAGFGTQIGEWQTRPEVSAHNVMAFGTTVYMTYYHDGVRVLDIADPAQPRLVAWFNTWPGYRASDPRYGRSFFDSACGLDVDLTRNRIYVADIQRNLIILQR